MEFALAGSAWHSSVSKEIKITKLIVIIIIIITKEKYKMAKTSA